MSDVSAVRIQEVSGSIFRLIRGMLRDRDEALDLTQEVLVRLLRRPEPDDPVRFKGYSMKAAYHAALNALRDRKRQARIQQRMQAEAESFVIGPSERECPDETMRLRRRLGEALAQLSPKQRAAVEFRFYGGLTTDQISEAMNISTGSVKVHMHRALNRLSELMTTIEEKQI